MLEPGRSRPPGPQRRRAAPRLWGSPFGGRPRCTQRGGGSVKGSPKAKGRPEALGQPPWGAASLYSARRGSIKGSPKAKGRPEALGQPPWGRPRCTQRGGGSVKGSPKAKGRPEALGQPPWGAASLYSARRGLHHRPSPSASPGMARSVPSFSRCQASRVACLASSQCRREVPRALSQPAASSGSTSS